MKIQIASDLHLEHVERFERGSIGVRPRPDADVLVLAGDIDTGANAVRKFAALPIPVVMVPGNHEAYGGDLDNVLAEMKRAAEGTNVHVLCAKTVEIGDVSFCGTTLWTDYRLDGELGDSVAMWSAERSIVDHRRISYRGRRFRASDAQALHFEQRGFVEDAPAACKGRKRVLVTHHGVHPLSVHSKYQGNPINPAFVSDLGALLDPFDLVIHGHVHDSFDYTIGRTRVVVNPRGYPIRLSPDRTAITEWENPAFDPELVIEI